MISTIRNAYKNDCLLVANALKNSVFDTNILEAINRLKSIIEHLPLASLNQRRIINLCQAVNRCQAAAALTYSLYFRVSRPLAIISGAGLAGLTASFELRARGFKVVIVEKRKQFSRFNLINLDMEVQVFLRKFNLLEKFEEFVAARIKAHRLVLLKKDKSPTFLGLSDVSTLQLHNPPSFEPKHFNELFNQDGVYSVSIALLQTFLAEHALEAGVTLLGDTTVTILDRTPAGGVLKVQITADRILQPDLFFIAEGAHASTARQLGMSRREVTNACTGENWIFGNMDYSGKETFVVTLVDTSERTLRIANVIFNAKTHLINIAVTSSKNMSKNNIREQVLRAAHQVFTQTIFPLEIICSALLTTVSKPVHVANRTFSPFSMGNVFCIGDAAGSSSPLAGLGGTLALTLVPRTVRQLVDDFKRQSDKLHENFRVFSKGYTSRWIEKSQEIKTFCLSLFDKEHESTGKRMK